MAKKRLKCNAFSVSSIEALQKELIAYRDSLDYKMEQIVSRLAEKGIEVAKDNVGNFGHHITFTYKIEQNSKGIKAIMIAKDSSRIISTWKSYGEIKTAEVSPILMAEFGSGAKAENPKDVAGVGQGTFPNQTHAFDAEGWYWMDENDEWHHSDGYTPTHPMIRAYEEMEKQIIKVAKEVFR